MSIKAAAFACIREAAAFCAWCVALLVILIVAGCGGGVSGSNAPPPSATPQPARNITFAYYGAVPGMAAEVADHVNAIMVPPWVADQVPLFQEARAAGLPVIWYPLATPDLYQQLVHLRALGLLADIRVVYPCDEPDINPCPDPTTVRATLALFPELRAKLATIYSASGRFPGIEAYDWVGVDDYGAGVNVLGGKVADLRSRLAPHQQLILVPGGADPWRTPPQPFLDYALADSRVAMIMPFVWFDRPDGPDAGKGIGANGMAGEYRAVGRVVK